MRLIFTSTFSKTHKTQQWKKHNRKEKKGWESSLSSMQITNKNIWMLHSKIVFYFYFRSSLIYWKCEKQHDVSIPPSETEDRTLANVTFEAQWLLYLLHDLRIHDLKHVQSSIITGLQSILQTILFFSSAPNILKLSSVWQSSNKP